MKGLAELQSENDALVARADLERKAAIQRLKRRIADRLLSMGVPDYQRRFIRAETEDWAQRETKRGTLR